MNFTYLRELPEQLVTFWRNLSASAKVGLVATITLIIAAISLVGYWSSQPQFMPLAAGLAPTEAAEIISRLETQNIRYEMNFSGSTVSVPKSQWNKAQALIGELVSPSALAGDDWNEAVLGSPETARHNRLRQREQSLARTLRQMAGVADASIHIAVGERSPFIQDEEPTTASVVLKLRGNGSFTREHAASIVAMLAGSVEGLDPENVSVMDTAGRMLSSPAAFADSEITGQFEFRRRLESDLAAKANSLLWQLLGDGKAMVRVAADVDFTRLQREETTFDPTQKVRTFERISSTQTTGGSLGPGGPSGTTANRDGNAVSLVSGTGPSKETIEDNETQYENAKTIDKVTQAPGRIKRLTVAVMADPRRVAAPSSDSAAPPANSTTPLVTQEQLAAIVKQAVGFDESRGDQIEVLLTEFQTVPEATNLVTVQNWDRYIELARNLSLGIAAIVALLLGWMTLSKLKPVTIRVEGEGNESKQRDEILSGLSERIRNNPEAMRTIISAWMADDEPQPSRRRAA